MYKKPVCHCGGELLWVELEYVEVQYRITKKGEPYKKAYDRFDKFGTDTHNMKCMECNNRYGWDYDDKGRIIIEE